MKTGFLTAAVAIMFALPTTAVHASPPGHITGLGGVFVTSKDPASGFGRDILGTSGRMISSRGAPMMDVGSAPFH